MNTGLDRLLKRAVLAATLMAAIAVLFQAGADQVKAFGTPGGVLFVSHSGDVVWDSEGQAWQLLIEGGDTWQRRPASDLPIPPSEVAFLHGATSAVLMSTSGQIWFNQIAGSPWQYRGSFNGGPVTLDQQSWGQIKGAHR